MINRMYISIILLSFLIFFNSCDDEWIFDIPGCMDQNALNYDPNATSDNGSCNYIEIFSIDASEYFLWVYFSFSLGEVVNISDPESSMDWDIAFSRNNIKTNGGESSDEGKVCAIVDDTQIWTNDSFEYTEQISDGVCQTDELIEGNTDTYEGCYGSSATNHEFIDCVKNPALDHWGLFDNTFNFNISNYQFFVKGVDGDYVKIWLMGYKDVNGETGHISMAYKKMD